MRLRALLLAGGAGTRLWPLSTEDRPKQFLKLRGRTSLLHDAYERVRAICEENVFVATAEKYGDLTLQELRTISAGQLLLEPSRRNTGPAILCAALRFERDGDDVVAALPADQTIADDEAFCRALSEAARAAARERSIVTLGIRPTHPETEYGYIEVEKKDDARAHRVKRFVEKPDRERAQRFISAGSFFWNAGIFIFKPSDLLTEAETTCPAVLEACRGYDRAWRERDDAKERAAYAAIPSISIDYAVMEKASKLFCVPCDAGWSDLGSYRAIRDLKGADERGNLVLSDRPVLYPGVSDSVIAVTAEGALVMPFSGERELRAAVEGLKKES